MITLEDYSASIHLEILGAITRQDSTIIPICQDRAIDEMRGYLSSRYDTDKIFSAIGTDRSPLVLSMAIDITVYHLFCIHNPHKLTQMRKDRYDRAVEWLKAVRRGDISPYGLPLIATPQERTSPYQMRSNPKRNNRL